MAALREHSPPDSTGLDYGHTEGLGFCHSLRCGRDGCRDSLGPWSENPNGIPPSSPGLAGTAYPG